MAEVLSQQQIDELLGNIQSGSVDFQEIEEQTSSKKIKEYDFLSPNKFTREQLRFLQNIFENFSRLISLHLSSLLRLNCEAEVIQVEEEEYREFMNAQGDSTLIGVMGMHSPEHGIEDKQILMELSRQISFSILDRMLGGDGGGYAIDRDYTEIELSLLEHLFRQVATILKNAWNNYIDMDYSMDGLETNSQLVQFIQPDESVAIVVIEVALGDVLKGNMNVCLPATSLEAVFKVFDSKYIKFNRKVDPEQEKERREHIMDSIKDTSLTVSALLGKAQINLRDLLQLQAGDIIPLDTLVEDDSIVLQVDRLKWFAGKIGVQKKNYAVKIGKVLQ